MKCCRTNWMRRNPQGPTWQETTAQQQAFAWRFLEMGPACVGKQLGTIASHRPEFSYYRGGSYDESRSTGGHSFGRLAATGGSLSYIFQKDCTIVNLLLV